MVSVRLDLTCGRGVPKQKGAPSGMLTQSILGEECLRRPNLPTKIIPTKICRLSISGEFPTDVRIPPLEINMIRARTKMVLVKVVS